ncbi:MAG: 50S ribosomal protein L19 [Candidatus Gracilibacteria bacterium]|jgi:large subunit ribosomal protein L19|nr:50S ribosomal protein L19 [Candidatus Gracilibacteria bacterium]
MSITIQELQAEGKKENVLPFKSGQTVRVHETIREGEKERIQIFEGLIIQKGGQGSSETITVRKIIDGIGVEKVFAIHSAVVAKIEFVKEAKTRRSKMFFMRERSGKSARLKEKFLTEKDIQKMAEATKKAAPKKAETASEPKEEVKAEEKAETNE